MPEKFRLRVVILYGMSSLEALTNRVAERAAGLALYARQWVDAATADDVVQEALTALLIERRTPDDPIAWMYRSVRNAAIDHARLTSRRRRREQALAATRCDWFEGRVDSLLDAQMAEQALKQLSAEYREIVVMRIWGDLGFAEIAAVMDLSVSTVHDRYVSALRQLRSAMEKPCKTKTN